MEIALVVPIVLRAVETLYVENLIEDKARVEVNNKIVDFTVVPILLRCVETLFVDDLTVDEDRVDVGDKIVDFAAVLRAPVLRRVDILSVDVLIDHK